VRFFLFLFFQDGSVTAPNSYSFSSLLTAHVIHFTICSFLGREPLQVTVCKKGHSHKDNKATPTPTPIQLLFEQAMVAKLGKKKVEEIKAADNATYKERTANKVNVCRGCDKGTTNRENFKRCVACWKIDREILYCSQYVETLPGYPLTLLLLCRECQRANWKQHKLMCGKPLEYDMAVKLATSPSTSDDASDIPPPANGFKPPLDVSPSITHCSFDHHDFPSYKYKCDI